MARLAIGCKAIAKLHPSMSSHRHAAFLSTGARGACPDRRPFGHPGERPHGFGGLAGVPSASRSAATPRRTRQGVRRSAGYGRSHGSRRSATAVRASRSCVYAASTSHVQRSAWAGWRSRGVVQPSVCLRKRKVCSRSKRRTYARQMTAKSGGCGPCHQSQSTCGSCVMRGRRLTSTRTSVPGTIGAGPRVPRPACRCTFGCNPAHARTRTVPYCSSVGSGQVVGSLQSNLRPWRGGRPVSFGGGGLA